MDVVGQDSVELLNRGSQVRVLAGAPFPKEFADFDYKKIDRQMFINKNDQSDDFWPELGGSFLSVFSHILKSRPPEVAQVDNVILGLEYRGSPYAVGTARTVDRV